MIPSSNSNNNFPLKTYYNTLGDSFVGKSDKEGSYLSINEGFNTTNPLLGSLPFISSDIRSLTKEALENLTPQKPLFFNLALQTSEGGHAVVLCIEKDPVTHSLTISVINTGLGLKNHSSVLVSSDQGSSLLYQCFLSYTRIQIDDFIRELPRLQKGMEKHKETIDAIDFLYTAFFEELNPTKVPPFSYEEFPQYYQKPQKAGVCGGKSLFAAMRFFMLKNSDNKEEALHQYKKYKLDHRIALLKNLLKTPALAYQDILFAKDVYQKLARAIEKQRNNPAITPFLEYYENRIESLHKEITLQESALFKAPPSLTKSLKNPNFKTIAPLTFTPANQVSPLKWNCPEVPFPIFSPPPSKPFRSIKEMAEALNDGVFSGVQGDIFSSIIKWPTDTTAPKVPHLIFEGWVQLLFPSYLNSSKEMQRASGWQILVNMEEWARGLPPLKDPYWESLSPEDTQKTILLFSFLHFISISYPGNEHNFFILNKLPLLVYKLTKKTHPDLLNSLSIENLIQAFQPCLNPRDIAIVQDIDTFISENTKKKLTPATFYNIKLYKQLQKKNGHKEEDLVNGALLPSDLNCIRFILLTKKRNSYDGSLCSYSFSLSQDQKRVSHKEHTVTSSILAPGLTRLALKKDLPLFSLPLNRIKGKESDIIQYHSKDALVRAFSEKHEKSFKWVLNKEEMEQLMRLVLHPTVIGFQMDKDPLVLLNEIKYLQNIYKKLGKAHLPEDPTLAECSLLFTITYMKNALQEKFPDLAIPFFSEKDKQHIKDSSELSFLREKLASNRKEDLLLVAPFLLQLPPPSDSKDRSTFAADYAFAFSVLLFFQIPEDNDRGFSTFSRPEFLFAGFNFFNLFRNILKSPSDLNTFKQAFASHLQVDSRSLRLDLQGNSLSIYYKEALLTKIDPCEYNSFKLDTATCRELQARVSRTNESNKNLEIETKKQLDLLLKIIYGETASLSTFSFDPRTIEGSFKLNNEMYAYTLAGNATSLNSLSVENISSNERISFSLKNNAEILYQNGKKEQFRWIKNSINQWEKQSLEPSLLSSKNLYIKQENFSEGYLAEVPETTLEDLNLPLFTCMKTSHLLSSSCLYKRNFLNGPLSFEVKNNHFFGKEELAGFTIIQRPHWNPLFNKNSYESTQKDVKHTKETVFSKLEGSLFLYNEKLDTYMQLVFFDNKYLIFDIELTSENSFRAVPRDPENLPLLLHACLDQEIFDEIPFYLEQLNACAPFSDTLIKNTLALLDKEKEHPKALITRLKLTHTLLLNGLFLNFDTSSLSLSLLVQDLTSYLKNRSNVARAFKLKREEELFLLQNTLQLLFLLEESLNPDDKKKLKKVDTTTFLLLANPRKALLERQPSASYKEVAHISHNPLLEMTQIEPPKDSTGIYEELSEYDKTSLKYASSTQKNVEKKITLLKAVQDEFDLFDLLNKNHTLFPLFYKAFIKLSKDKKETLKLIPLLIRLEKISVNKEVSWKARLFRAILENPRSTPPPLTYEEPQGIFRYFSDITKIEEDKKNFKDNLISTLQKWVNKVSSPKNNRKKLLHHSFPQTNPKLVKRVTTVTPFESRFNVETPSSLDYLKMPQTPLYPKSKEDFLKWLHQYETSKPSYAIQKHTNTLSLVTFKELSLLFLKPNWKELLKKRTSLPEENLEQAEQLFFHILKEQNKASYKASEKRAWDWESPVAKIFLIFELEHRLHIRKIQSDAITDFLNTLEKRGTNHAVESIQEILLFSTGTGKSSVLAPLFAWLHKTRRAVVNVWPKSLFRENAIKTKSTLLKIGEKVIYFTFKRQSSLDMKELVSLFNALKAQHKKGCTIQTTADSLQSFELQFLQEVGSPEKSPLKIQLLQSILLFFKHSAVHLDESHVLLSPFKELNFDVGKRHACPLNEVTLISDLLLHLNAHLSLKEGLYYQLPPEELQEKIKLAIQDLFKARNYPKDTLKYVLGETKNLEELRKKEGLTSETLEELSLLRGECLYLLPETLSKVPNLDYGKKDTFFAVPYQGADDPLPNSEFANIHETLTKTFQIYLNDKLSKENQASLFEHLRDKMVQEMEFSHKEQEKTASFKTLSKFFLLPEKKNLFTIPSSEIPLNTDSEVEATLLYVRLFVTPSIQSNQFVFRSTSANLSSMFEDRRAFSATPGKASLYGVAEIYDPSSKNLYTDTVLIRRQVEAKFNINSSSFEVKPTITLNSLIETCLKNPQCRMLVDGGAKLKGTPPFTVAQAFFKQLEKIPNSPIKGFVYYEGDRRFILEKGATTPRMVTESSSFTPNELFTFCDQAHSFGTDTVQINEALAVITIDVNTDTDTFLQNIGRLRQFMNINATQNILVALDEATAARMQENNTPLTIHTLFSYLDKNLEHLSQKGVLKSLEQKLFDSLRKEALEILLETPFQNVDATYEKLKHFFLFSTPQRPSEMYGFQRKHGTGAEEILNFCEKMKALSKEPLTGKYLEKTLKYVQEVLKDEKILPPEVILGSEINQNQSVEVSSEVSQEVAKEVAVEKTIANNIQRLNVVYKNWPENFDPYTKSPLKKNTLEKITYIFKKNMKEIQNIYLKWHDKLMAIVDAHSTVVVGLVGAAITLPISLSPILAVMAGGAPSTAIKVAIVFAASLFLLGAASMLYILLAENRFKKGIHFSEKTDIPHVLPLELALKYHSSLSLSFDKLFPSSLKVPLLCTENFILNNSQVEPLSSFDLVEVPREVLLIKENNQWSILVGDLTHDALFFKRKLISEKKASHQRELVLWDLNLGIIAGRTSENQEKDILENEDLQKALIRLKLYKHDSFFTPAERLLLPSILSENISEWKAFFEQTASLRESVFSLSFSNFITPLLEKEAENLALSLKRTPQIG